MRRIPIAIYDANILYSAPIRDLLIRLAQSGLVRARWTDQIHDEWIRSVLKNNPQLTLVRLERTRSLMNQAIRNCLVTDYEALIEALDLPDADDRHVLAAAIASRADLILTFNLKDFPSEALGQFGIEAVHPDEFLLRLITQNPTRVCSVIHRQREALRNPPLSAGELLETLARQGLEKSVDRLQPYLNEL
jgi:predicted nucleic acid-binding protein